MMAVQHDISIPGCTPEPLMAYLKALGILRLVSEQKDDEARGWWKDDVFWLRSTLNTDTLVEFFLEEYAPTAIVAPWGARSGFFSGSSEKTAREALEEIVATESPRLVPFQRTTSLVRTMLRELSLDEKAKDEEKLKLLEVCRNRFPDEVLDWLDACYVLTADDRKFPPLLGTGGNEGSGSYVSGFAQLVVECVLKRRHDHSLVAALLALTTADSVTRQAPGHFSPNAVGGPNAGQGFSGHPATNAWDYLLCLEGTCVWASATVRRLGRQGRSMAAFPFTVNVSGAGDPGIAFGDQFKPKQAKRSIAEMWLPLWSRATSLAEVRSLIAEGKVTVAGRDAQTGVDFARAASTLGVDRGIDEFQRTMFLMRNGQSFLAISVGRFDVRERREADLLGEVDGWLRSFARAAGDKKAPPRFRAAQSRIEEAIFDLCRHGGRTHLQSVLLALGQAERELSLTPGGIGHSKVAVRPLVGLSAQWVTQTEDLTTEFVIARALAAMRDDEFKVGPFRAHLEAAVVTRTRSGESYADWTEKGRAVVWNAADLSTNLMSVLQRRVMDGARAGCECLPLASRFTVPLHMISAFIAGEVDDERIEDLIWGLMLVNQDSGQLHVAAPADDRTVPRSYALLKLLFLPRPLVIQRSDRGVVARLLRDDEQGGVVIRPEPSVLHVLRNGRLGEACGIAMRRLRASGLDPLPGSLPRGGVRDGEWRELDHMGGAGLEPQRLAAALLVPISDASVRTLVRLVIRGDEMRDNETETGAAVRLEGDALL